MCYGISSTRIMMTAGRFIAAVYPDSVPVDAEERIVQLLGAALSFGSGLGGVGCYFLVQDLLST